MIKVITKQQLLDTLPPLEVTQEVETMQEHSYELEQTFKLAAVYIGLFALFLLVVDIYVN